MASEYSQSAEAVVSLFLSHRILLWGPLLAGLDLGFGGEAFVARCHLIRLTYCNPPREPPEERWPASSLSSPAGLAKARLRIEYFEECALGDMYLLIDPSINGGCVCGDRRAPSGSFCGDNGRNPSWFQREMACTSASTHLIIYSLYPSKRTMSGNSGVMLKFIVQRSHGGTKFGRD